MRNELTHVNLRELVRIGDPKLAEIAASPAKHSAICPQGKAGGRPSGGGSNRASR